MAKAPKKRIEKDYSGEENSPLKFEFPKLKLEQLNREENDALNSSVEQALEAILHKKQGKPLSELLETPILDVKDLEPFQKAGLTKDDVNEIQSFVDAEVGKFVDRQRVAAIPIVGRVVVSIVASKIAKKISKKTNM